MSFVLGLDPGLANLGWAVLDDQTLTLAEVGLITTSKSQKTKPGQDFFDRTQLMSRRLGAVVDRIQPAALVLETFSFLRHAKSSAMLAVSHGQIVQLCEDLDLPIVAITRADVMAHVGVKPTARGRAARKIQIKEGVVAFAKTRWPLEQWKTFNKAAIEHPADAAVTALAAVALGRYSKARRHYESRIVISAEE